MEDKIDVFPVSGTLKHKLEIRKEIPLKAGGLEPKKVIYATLRRKDKTKQISLIERGLDNDAQHYIDKWIIFKKAGMPVVPTCRKTDRNSVLVTNVKVDGSEVYGKGLWTQVGKYYQSKQDNTERQPHPLDNYFLELTEADNIQQIKQCVNSLIQRANQNHLILPFDDAFELLIHPNKTWELIILDLTNADKITDPTFGRSLQRARNRNGNAGERFIQDIVNLRKLLLEKQR